MTAAAKKPAKAAPARARATLADPTPPKAPSPAAVDHPNPASAKDPALTPVPGLDPRGAPLQTLEGGGYVDAAGAVHAPPPTPTRESALTANDEPGAGSSDPSTLARPRRVLLEDEATVKVEPLAKAFILTDGAGEHSYPAGTTVMAKSHVNHWYAKAHGVKAK